MDLEMKGNSALITASSSGLGKAVAKAMVQEGVNVVVNGRHEDKLKQTVQELNDLNRGKVVGQVADITKKDDIIKLVDTTYNTFGKLDHIITSAGGPPSKSFMETTDEEWYKTFDLLVMSVVRLVREAKDYLEEGDGGTIVNLTSRSVKEAIEGLVLSNSVRMSVIGLMKTLSKELGPKIRVNAILQGLHETDRLKDLLEKQVAEGKFKTYEEAFNVRSNDIPLKRIGQPHELGEVATFLSSKKSSYLNGVSIVLDGGGSHSNL
ncbi:MAG TPA: SDR family oxidoreductase [Halanaerobiales bacterium]|nr:SDR family oxidoreductase [Halanaerobiales bacterium]